MLGLKYVHDYVVFDREMYLFWKGDILNRKFEVCPAPPNTAHYGSKDSGQRKTRGKRQGDTILINISRKTADRRDPHQQL